MDSKNLLFYQVPSDYINFMHRLDGNVQLNDPNPQNIRPYVGVVIEINGHDYYAPLSSYKPSYKKKKQWFYKIYNDLAKDPVSILKFNCMIPIQKEELIYMDFSKFNSSYKDLLEAEYQYIKLHKSSILAQATFVYDKVTKKESGYLQQTCVDYSKLENHYKTFKSSNT